MARDHKFHEPTTYEANEWEAFARMARDCATGKRRCWGALSRAASGVVKHRVFGVNDRANVCNLLVQISVDASASVAPERYFDELHRLADEVLKRCVAWRLVRAAQVSK